MVADQPLIVYDEDGSDGKACTRENADKLADAWAEKRKTRKLKFEKGKAVSLKEYLNS